MLLSNYYTDKLILINNKGILLLSVHSDYVLINSCINIKYIMLITNYINSQKILRTYGLAVRARDTGSNLATFNFLISLAGIVPLLGKDLSLFLPLWSIFCYWTPVRLVMVQPVSPSPFQSANSPFRVVKQGDPLTPKLFTGVLEEVFRNLAAGWDDKGIVVGEKSLNLSSIRWWYHPILSANYI